TSVIGVSSVPSRGIKKGVVVDIDEAVESISDGLLAAERMAGYTVPAAYVSVDGKHISSLNSHGVVAVSAEGSEITNEDVERVTEAARA
ncbi:cell division protein FtsA, partial [Candidatus Saccharibacteria bacterium]|nr:cell division protein FtsA [Candidatus Saccharibacteria bacterium]